MGRRKRTDAILPRIVALGHSGLSRNRICDIVGCGRGTVMRILNQAGIPPIKSGKKPKVKMDPREVRERARQALEIKLWKIRTGELVDVEDEDYRPAGVTIPE